MGKIQRLEGGGSRQVSRNAYRAKRRCRIDCEMNALIVKSISLELFWVLQSRPPRSFGPRLRSKQPVPNAEGHPCSRGLPLFSPPAHAGRQLLCCSPPRPQTSRGGMRFPESPALFPARRWPQRPFGHPPAALPALPSPARAQWVPRYPPRPCLAQGPWRCQSLELLATNPSASSGFSQRRKWQLARAPLEIKAEGRRRGEAGRAPGGDAPRPGLRAGPCGSSSPAQRAELPDWSPAPAPPPPLHLAACFPATRSRKEERGALAFGTGAALKLFEAVGGG